MNLSTTFKTTSLFNGAKGMIASSLFLNSGVKNLFIASVSASRFFPLPKPIYCFVISTAPAFVVIINTTFRKSTDFPLVSVRRPWSIT